MRKMARLASIMMVLVLGFSTTVHAEKTRGQMGSKNVIHEDLVGQGTVLYGAKPPTGSSFVDIVNNDYSFNVSEMTIGLYTNTLFKGASKVSVTVEKISVDKNGMQNESKGITVHLRKKGSSLDVEHSVPLSGETFYFSDLDPAAMYYLEFTKQSDSQIYTFKGAIKNAN